jgi:hypothetical protein
MWTLLLSAIAWFSDFSVSLMTVIGLGELTGDAGDLVCGDEVVVVVVVEKGSSRAARDDTDFRQEGFRWWFLDFFEEAENRFEADDVGVEGGERVEEAVKGKKDVESVWDISYCYQVRGCGVGI